MSTIADKTQELENTYHFNFYRRSPLTLIKGIGTKVYDSEGKEYIDALAGIAVNLLGHAHPELVKAISDQASKLMHISNIYYNVPQSSLARLLTELSRMDKVFFCNSGAEANEGALKLIRKYAHKKGRAGKIISFTNCFHGRTIATISMGQPKYQAGFGPLPEGFVQFPFNDLAYFEEHVGDDTIGVFVEPIQGEGGINPATPEFLRGLREICSKKGILLAFDEIQCGMGRTGKFLASQHIPVEPDVLTLAKGLGGGIPIGAVLAKAEVAAAFDPGDHGTTFGGNPLACAVAYETLRIIIRDNLMEKATQNGKYISEKLKALQTKVSTIKEVRGNGLMIGINLKPDGKKVMQKMMGKGVLVNCTADNTIRLLPPLIVQKVELEQVFRVFTEALTETEYEEK
jgi:acetylornithine/N-succinyldiaminopimelate aminotransferase